MTFSLAQEDATIKPGGLQSDPDVAAFAQLVNARRRGDHKKAMTLVKQLRVLGWRVAATAPQIGGGR